MAHAESHAGIIYHVITETIHIYEFTRFGPFHCREAMVPSIKRKLRQESQAGLAELTNILSRPSGLASFEHLVAPLEGNNTLVIRIVAEHSPGVAATLPGPSWVVMLSELSITSGSKPRPRNMSVIKTYTTAVAANEGVRQLAADKVQGQRRARKLEQLKSDGTIGCIAISSSATWWIESKFDSGMTYHDEEEEMVGDPEPVWHSNTATTGRSSMRMTVAQLQQLTEPERTRSQGSIQPPYAMEKPDTLYTVTEHTTSAHGFLYSIIFGPTRSISDALYALAQRHPRAMTWLADMHNLEWEPHNHFRWQEPNGNSVVVEIEQETNPAVFATDDTQELFIIIRRVTNFDDNPISEIASLRGTFATKPEAAVAALRLFRADVTGQDVDRKESVKSDGLLHCEAQSKGEGGYRWTVEVIKGSWAHTR